VGFAPNIRTKGRLKANLPLNSWVAQIHASQWSKN
jgi:hypothetical protein